MPAMLVRLMFFIQFLVPSVSEAQISFFTEDQLKNMFVLKADGDCTDGQLPGDFVKFSDITQSSCASYCNLNKDCKGFSYAEKTPDKGECILKSINDCATRAPGATKFYSKKL